MDIPVSTLLQKKLRSASAPDLVIVLLFLNNNNIMHKRMLPDKAIMLNPLHNADFLTCNKFR